MRHVRWFGLAAMVVAAFAIAQPAPEKVYTQNGVSFMSGGIGLDSQARLEARERDFNLKLVFTLVEGNYVADVGVTIQDAAGKNVVQLVVNGPFLMARLPTGKYAVNAVYDGKMQTRQVEVRVGRLRTEYLRWPSKPGVDYPLPPESPR